MVMAMCAFLLAMYRYLGNAIFGILVIAVASLVLGTWVLDAFVMMKSLVGRIARVYDAQDDLVDLQVSDCIRNHETIVKNLRDIEQNACDRYDSAAGPLEDVLHAKGLRLKAEIDLIREQAASWRSATQVIR